MYFEKWFPVDLLKLPNHVLDVGMPLFVGDNDAIRIGATVQRGGEDENITGTVKGYVILPNGADIVPFDGSKDGNKAWLDLPSDALCLSGRIQIAIRVFDGSAVTTLLATSATVRRADADQHFDPEDVVGDITDLIHEAETAAASAQEAAETAQEALTLAENIVSYTEQTGKTDAQKQTARGNIAAVGAEEHNSLSDRVDAVGIAVNYGYVDEEQTATINGVTGVRKGSRIKLNGTSTASGSTSTRFRMNGSLLTVSGTPTAAQNNGTAVLLSGHQYTIRMKLVSGSASYDGETNIPVTVAPFKSGSTTVYINTIREKIIDEGWFLRSGIGDGSAVTLWLSFTPGATFVNAVYDVVLTDDTMAKHMDDALLKIAEMQGTPLKNMLQSGCNVCGYFADVGRNVTVIGNRVTYKHTASSSTGRGFPMTGSYFRYLSTDSSYKIPTSAANVNDFIEVPPAILLPANKRKVYLWFYSPDNMEMTSYVSAEAQKNKIEFASRDQDETVHFANGGAGSVLSNHSGYVVYAMAKSWPTSYANMASAGNVALYYITKTNNAAKNGTLYWGIGLADHDLYDEEDITDTEVTITADSGITYNCIGTGTVASPGATTSLSFTPSASGLCGVRFKSGTTATALTIPSSVKMPSWWTGVEANRTYEIMVSDGVYGAVMSWA